MLKHCSSDFHFRVFHNLEKDKLSKSDLIRLGSKQFKSAFFKMQKVSVDLIRNLLFSLYSSNGRPADDPAVLVRSFILKQHFGFTSVKLWVNAVHNDPLLQYLIGSWNVPGFSTHYDFIVRLTGRDPSLDEAEVSGLFQKKNKEKLKKGDKWVNYTNDDVLSLCDKFSKNPSFSNDRGLYTLQSLMNSLVVIPSADLGLIPSDDFRISGDGTCLHVHASSFGHKIDKSIDDSSALNYRYSCPDGDIGWDSDLGKWYFGFTLFNLSTHNHSLHIDLPLFLSLNKASQHDALSSVSALAQFMDMNPDLHPKYALFDCAMDALPFYSFLLQHHIIPVIDRNKRKSSDPPVTDDDRIPICNAGFKMIPWGYDQTRLRTKYRCPLACGKVSDCPCRQDCSSSDYGKTVYIKALDNPRDNSPLVYRSDEWCDIYKDRTCTERINTRILNDYKQHQQTVREGAKHAFLAIFSAINIHLDAWYKVFGDTDLDLTDPLNFF